MRESRICSARWNPMVGRFGCCCVSVVSGYAAWDVALPDFSHAYASLRSKTRIDEHGISSSRPGLHQHSVI
jgi:hypothetical protein